MTPPDTSAPAVEAMIARLQLPSEFSETQSQAADMLAAQAAEIERLTRERDEAKLFIEAELDRAPDSLLRLGQWLSNVLDDDRWKTADRMLLGGVVEANGVAAKLAKVEAERDTFMASNAGLTNDALALRAEVRAQAAEIERLTRGLKVVQAAARAMDESKSAVIRHLEKPRKKEREAVATLDSERSANEILTAENEALRTEIATLKESACELEQAAERIAP